MVLARLFGFTAEADEDMARKSSVKKPASQATVAVYADQLRAAQMDRAAFNAVLEAIRSDPELGPLDVAAIGNVYAVGGIKATSRRAGLDRIEKRFIELVRDQAKRRVAEKFRPI